MAEIKGWVDKYIEYLRYERNYSLHTEISYFNDINQFCEFLNIRFTDWNWKSLNVIMLRDWVVALMENGHSTRSVNRKIAAVKAFYRFLLTKNYIETNPVEALKGPKIQKKLPTFIQDEDLNELLDALYLMADDFESMRDALILDLFYQTGIRRAELIGIRDIDIDKERKTLLVTGKRNKQRSIPVSDNLICRIEEYQLFRDAEVVNNFNLLFVKKKEGGALYPMLVYRIVNNQLKQLPRLSKMSPHVLRHTFATSMLNAGADINAVKEILGHVSLAATEIYTHTSFEELKRIYNKAHPRE